MRLGFLIILFSVSISAFLQSEVQDFEKLDLEKAKSDIKIIKAEMDSAFYYINATYEILKEEVKLFRWRKTLQINSRIFLPPVLLGLLYLVWLLNRYSKN